MIGKPEIIRIAGQINLNPHVVEKDYALGNEHLDVILFRTICFSLNLIRHSRLIGVFNIQKIGFHYVFLFFRQTFRRISVKFSVSLV